MLVPGVVGALELETVEPPGVVDDVAIVVGAVVLGPDEVDTLAVVGAAEEELVVAPGVLVDAPPVVGVAVLDPVEVDVAAKVYDITVRPCNLSF